ncbi:hypothetical protein LTR86_005961 [Recurvomyces mirabilis]|nr:hypothetical protein LTR86_005961 [Recurvomyces mirabilis]
MGYDHRPGRHTCAYVEHIKNVELTGTYHSTWTCGGETIDVRYALVGEPAYRLPLQGRYSGKESPTPEETAKASGEIEADPLSPTAITKYRRWIAKCSREHMRCKRVSQSQPKRLLELLDLTNEMSDIRLVSSNIIAPDAQYVALSYCWGKDEPLKTDRTNIWQHQDRIEFAKLARTHQDAVKLVRKLGIRYLWIDALCIVQDDPGEWTAEAARMGKIFHGAAFDLVVARASSATEGFLQPRQTTVWRECRLPEKETDLRSVQSDYTGISYMAGMWRTEDFVSQLAWKRIDRVGDNTLIPSHAEYIAPSWSWASIEAQVKIHLPQLPFDVDRAEKLGGEGGRNADCATLIDVHCTPVQEPYGAVKAGYCTLEGLNCGAYARREEFWCISGRDRRSSGLFLDGTWMRGSFIWDTDTISGRSRSWPYEMILQRYRPDRQDTLLRSCTDSPYRYQANRWA